LWPGFRAGRVRFPSASANAATEIACSDEEAAALLGVSATTVRRMRYTGTLDTIRVRNSARVREADVLAYIARGGVDEGLLATLT